MMVKLWCRVRVLGARLQQLRGPARPAVRELATLTGERGLADRLPIQHVRSDGCARRTRGTPPARPGPARAGTAPGRRPASSPGEPGALTVDARGEQLVLGAVIEVQHRLEICASAAIASIDASWNPLRENTSTAASRRLLLSDGTREPFGYLPSAPSATRSATTLLYGKLRSGWSRTDQCSARGYGTAGVVGLLRVLVDAALMIEATCSAAAAGSSRGSSPGTTPAAAAVPRSAAAAAEPGSCSRCRNRYRRRGTN